MGKRIKKSAIDAEKRMEWLRRNEHEGESPPQIAQKDGYDVRTVRKHIDNAKQERESREARASVLRNALEEHYEDLRHYAEFLDSELSSPGKIKHVEDEEFLMQALRQHVPRSHIWDFRSKRQNLQQQFDGPLLKNTIIRIERETQSDLRLTSLIETGLTGVVPGIVSALTIQAKEWSKGNPGLNLRDNLSMNPDGQGFTAIRYGSIYLGKIDDKHAKEYFGTILNVMKDLESKLKDWEEYREWEQANNEIGLLGWKLKDALAEIRLKRIVPGHCRFCPL